MFRALAFILVTLIAFYAPGANADWNAADLTKWVQTPDLATTGIDVNASLDADYDFLLADDFRCVVPDTIASIHIWGAWRDDYPPFGKNPESTKFMLGIHEDIPASASPTGFSMPGALLWSRVFLTGEFSAQVWNDDATEGWLNPPQQFTYPGATVCWQYNFPVPPGERFVQNGTSQEPRVYWLSVKAAPDDTSSSFGWKTSRDHWNDDAVWGIGQEPFSGPWKELVYPPGHILEGNSIDLAYAIVGTTVQLDWGDAPDSPIVPGYGTLAVNNGARHVIAGPWFGRAADPPPDGEPDGQPFPSAVGDDNSGIDDEGDALIHEIIQGFSVPLEWWVAGDTAYVEAWVDFNGDQVWQHPQERVVSIRWAPGHFLHPVPGPANTILGETYARFRISTDGGLTPYGHAPDGEVEDLLVEIVPQWDMGKCIQLPELSRNGTDVRCTPPLILADDFACTKTEKITEINIYGSWKFDNLPYGSPDSVRFILSFHDDIPADESQTGYSTPGDLLWLRTFEPGDFTSSVWRDSVPEGWMVPPFNYTFPGDTTCWYYTFYVPPDEAFVQSGSEVDTVVYWLDVQAIPLDPSAQFGWKSSWKHWNDAAVWGVGSEPYSGTWYELLYPPGNYKEGEKIDLAFRLGTGTPSGIEGESSGAKNFQLHQSYPNPFNPAVVIMYDVPDGGGQVTLQVFDVRGRLVCTLVDQQETAGRKTVHWNGTNEQGQAVASGVYFCRMTAGDFAKTRKMILLK